MEKMFVVFGLGTFGMQTAQALYRGGATVLVIDYNEQMVEHVSASVTQAVCAEATDEEALQAVGVFDANAAIVALRRHFDTSVLVTHLLKARGVKEILVQVDSEKEADAIRAVGATAVIFPERDMAERIARALLVPDLAEQIPLGDDVGIIETPCPPHFVSKTLIDLDIRRNFGVMVIAIKSRLLAEKGKEKVEVAPPPDQPLRPGDRLLVIGHSSALARFKESLSASSA